MKKRVLALLLALAMATSLCACGKEDKTEEKDNQSNNSSVVETPNNQPDNTQSENQGNVDNSTDNSSESNNDSENGNTDEPGEPIIIDTNPHLTSEIDTTGFADMNSDVAFTQFLLPDNMPVSCISYAEYTVAAIEKESLNPKKNAARIAELEELMSRTLKTTDKGYVSYITPEGHKTVAVMTLENNARYTGSDMNSGAMLKLLEKLVNKQGLGDKVTLKDITHKSKTKAIAEVIINNSDGTIQKGYFVVTLNTQYIATMLVCQDAYSLGKEWMLITAKSLEVGR